MRDEKIRKGMLPIRDPFKGCNLKQVEKKAIELLVNDLILESDPTNAINEFRHMRENWRNCFGIFSIR